jgi:hypothetical protein
VAKCVRHGENQGRSYSISQVSVLTKILQHTPEEDPDFCRSMEQIELREKIPLLDLPWGAGKLWTLVDLWEDYDEELLVRFYKELMVPIIKKEGNLVFLFVVKLNN